MNKKESRELFFKEIDDVIKYFNAFQYIEEYFCNDIINKFVDHRITVEIDFIVFSDFQNLVNNLEKNFNVYFSNNTVIFQKRYILTSIK